MVTKRKKTGTRQSYTLIAYSTTTSHYLNTRLGISYMQHDRLTSQGMSGSTSSNLQMQVTSYRGEPQRRYLQQ